MKWRLALVAQEVAGMNCPLPVVTLRVRDRYGGWVPLSFRVDTQADLTTVPITVARREGISFREDTPGRARGITGSVGKYRDRIRLLIAGQDHSWPCDFVQAAVDPETRRPFPEPLPVLGRAGFLEHYAIAVDDGYLILTRLGPIRRWWRRRLHVLWAWCGMIHPADRPL
jgi:hypothetical protein